MPALGQRGRNVEKSQALKEGRWRKCGPGDYCQYCGAIENLEADHIWPRSMGGPFELWNMQVLCAPCNRRKGNRTEFGDLPADLQRKIINYMG